MYTVNQCRMRPQFVCIGEIQGVTNWEYVTTREENMLPPFGWHTLHSRNLHVHMATFTPVFHPSASFLACLQIMSLIATREAFKDVIWDLSLLTESIAWQQKKQVKTFRWIRANNHSAGQLNIWGKTIVPLFFPYPCWRTNLNICFFVWTAISWLLIFWFMHLIQLEGRLKVS